MKRVKRAAEALPVPQSAEEASRMVAEIGAAQRQIAMIEAGMAEEVAAAKTAAEHLAAPLAELIEQHTRGLQIWAEANRALAEGKTIHLADGVLAWRARPPSVRIADTQAVLAEMVTHGLDRFIRIKREVNKEALLREPEFAEGIPGVTIRSGGEDFSVEPVGLSLSGGAA